jgi:putative Holliday junction resolvase
VKKAVGLDLGSKTCGIAISDSLGIAHPKEEFRFWKGPTSQCLAHVIDFLHQEGVKEIALGYPLNMDGSAGESAHRSERFKEELLEIDPSLNPFVDERLTTVMASRQLLEADLSRQKAARGHRPASRRRDSGELSREQKRREFPMIRHQRQHDLHHQAKTEERRAGKSISITITPNGAKPIT